MNKLKLITNVINTNVFLTAGNYVHYGSVLASPIHYRTSEIWDSVISIEDQI